MASHSVTSWNSLPAEVRLKVLGLIIHEKPYSWISLASVCKEWQEVFEKEQYKKLKIWSSRLDEFKSMVSLRKRQLIRHLWFDIELRNYNTRCCSKRHSSMKTIMGRTVSKVIREIFSILSTWEAGNELTLELNAVCPSDSEHWFGNAYFSSDRVGDDVESEKPDEVDCSHHDPDHCWIFGTKCEFPPSSAISQLLHPVELDEFEFASKPLPTVKAVTQLVIRRQLRRRTRAFSLAELLQRLPCLESIVYEPWLSQERWMEVDDERMSSNNLRQGSWVLLICHFADIMRTGLAHVIQTGLPGNVRRLVMFRESTEFYNELPLYTGRRFRLGGYDKYDMAVASKSLELHHLAVSFMVDAERVFQLCGPTWIWPNLQTLSLTAQLLRSGQEKRRDIEAFLVRAGNRLRQMPKMRTLVLWNGGMSHARAFMYCMDRNDYPYITWRGTWDMKMSPRIIESWQDVASTLPSCRPKVRKRVSGRLLDFMEMPFIICGCLYRLLNLHHFGRCGGKQETCSMTI